jgi:hypothetical protein
MVKYSCHIVLFGQIRKEGWRDDHMRFRKVLKEDELCPTCEKRLEREMCRTLHWLQPRVDFTTEVVHLYRNNTVKRVIDAALPLTRKTESVRGGQDSFEKRDSPILASKEKNASGKMPSFPPFAKKGAQHRMELQDTDTEYDDLEDSPAEDDGEDTLSSA